MKSIGGREWKARAGQSSARVQALGGDHTRHLSCGSIQVPAMRKVTSQYIHREGTLPLPSRYPGGRNAAVLGERRRGNARGT